MHNALLYVLIHNTGFYLILLPLGPVVAPSLCLYAIAQNLVFCNLLYLLLRTVLPGTRDHPTF